MATKYQYRHIWHKTWRAALEPNELEELDKMIVKNLDVSQIDSTRAQAAQKRAQDETVWKMLVRGYSAAQIQKDLAITKDQYHGSVQALVSKTKPASEDIERERQLAHDRMLFIYRKLHDEYEKAATTSDVTMIARELRSTVKEIGDIYSIKMPEKLEIDVNINEQERANRTIQKLLGRLNPQPELEGEIVEDEGSDDGT